MIFFKFFTKNRFLLIPALLPLPKKKKKRSILKKSTLSNTPYIISEFDLSVDSHIAEKVRMLTKMASSWSCQASISRLVNMASWGGFSTKSFPCRWINTSIQGLPKAKRALKTLRPSSKQILKYPPWMRGSLQLDWAYCSDPIDPGDFPPAFL